MALPRPSSPVWGVLAWAVYVATSWTWCIGMILPTLLTRDHGRWAAALFLVPNVLGAMSVPFVFRTADASLRFVASHEKLCAAFSWVTITFHVVAVGWLIGIMPLGAVGFALAAMGTCVIAAGLLRVSERAVGVGALVLSSTLLLVFLLLGEVGLPAEGLAPDGAFSDGPAPMLGVGLSCALGFLLCPHLDLTFHHVRQQTHGSSGRSVFVLGFLLLFPLMMLFSFAASGMLASILAGEARAPAWPAAVFLTHVLAQTALTVWLHGRALRRLRSASTGAPSQLLALVAPTLVLIAMVVGRLAHSRVGDIGAGELVYRLFLGAYALVFPACLVAMLWQRRWPSGTQEDRRLRLLVTAGVTCVLAAPMLYVGSVQRQAGWLVPGVLVTVLGPMLAELAFARMRGRERSDSPASGQADHFK